MDLIPLLQKTVESAAHMPCNKTGRVMSEQAVRDTRSSLRQLQAFWSDLNERGWAPGEPTIGLLRWKGLCPEMDEFTFRHAQEFRAWLLACGLKNASINSICARLAARFQDLYRTRVNGARLIPENPFNDLGSLAVAANKKPGDDIYSLEDERRLFQSLHASTALAEFAIFAELVSRTGARRVSILEDLSVERDFDEEAGTLRLACGTEGRKCGNPVTLPVDAGLRDALLALQQNGGWHHCPQTYTTTLGAACARLGIRVRQPIHAFRHTLVSRLSEVGEGQLAEMVGGWAVKGMRRAYTHETELRLDRLREALAKVPHPR